MITSPQLYLSLCYFSGAQEQVCHTTPLTIDDAAGFLCVIMMKKYGVRIVALFQINRSRFTNKCKEFHK